MNFPPVLNKRDFARRYKLGEFGNGSPTYDTLERFLNDFEFNKSMLFHLRNRIAGGVTHYYTPAQEIQALWESKQYRDQWYCSAMVPKEIEETLLLQGEVQETPLGLYLYFSRIAKPMREALRVKSEEKCGIIALCLLKAAMCWNSYSWLRVLLDRYPGHVVEFSSFCKQWGTVPGYNSIFWEVRLY
jgi:hypothetical protein